MNIVICNFCLTEYDLNTTNIIVLVNDEKTKRVCSYCIAEMKTLLEEDKNKEKNHG